MCGELAENVCGRPCPLCPICDARATTAVSGTVFTGARTSPDPIAGALVYVPHLPTGTNLPPLADRSTCRQCAPFAGIDVIDATVSGPDGRFVLSNVPAGSAIPLVVQLGGWRMQSTIDVASCVDNALPAGQARLPRNHGEGDIPLTAIVTGSHDPVECLLRKLGVEDTEFTNPGGAGRIHLYRSTGAIIDLATPDASELKGAAPSSGDWTRYSQILLPCEGAEILQTPEALEHFNAYVNGGGRVLATHFSYAWLFHNGSLANIGTWAPGESDPMDPIPTDVVTSLQAGSDFATWLRVVGALSRPSPPQMQITAPHADLGALAGAANLWLSSFSPPTTQLATIDAPAFAAADKVCGRIVFSDFHGKGASAPGTTFPSECEPDMTLTPQEKALEFMLFDLASCAGQKTIPPPGTSPPRGPPPPLPPPTPPPPNQP